MVCGLHLQYGSSNGLNWSDHWITTLSISLVNILDPGIREDLKMYNQGTAKYLCSGSRSNVLSLLHLQAFEFHSCHATLSPPLWGPVMDSISQFRGCDTCRVCHLLRAMFVFSQIRTRFFLHAIALDTLINVIRQAKRYILVYSKLVPEV